MSVLQFFNLLHISNFIRHGRLEGRRILRQKTGGRITSLNGYDAISVLWHLTINFFIILQYIVIILVLLLIVD